MMLVLDFAEATKTRERWEKKKNPTATRPITRLTESNLWVNNNNNKSEAMNGQHLRQTDKNSAKETWQWMKRGSLKRETESLIIAV